jgi:hypothetical protein
MKMFIWNIFSTWKFPPMTGCAIFAPKSRVVSAVWIAMGKIGSVRPALSKAILEIPSIDLESGKTDPSRKFLYVIWVTFWNSATQATEEVAAQRMGNYLGIGK